MDARSLPAELPSAASLPLVTTITPCYNQAQYIVATLDSIRLQTYPNKQMIIFDDCSKDDSVAVIEAWIEQYNVDCRFIRHERNMGLCATLNEGIGLAEGKYLGFLAGDDLWLEEKLAIQVAQLERLPSDYGVLYGDSYMVDEKGRRLPELFIAAHGGPAVHPEGKIFGELFERNFIPIPAMLVRRSCIDVIGLYDASLVYEDWDMWLRVAERFRIGYTPEIVGAYRVVGTSMVRTMNLQMTESNIQIYRKYLGRGIVSDDLLKARIAKGAETLYKAGYPRAGEYLRLAWKEQRSLRSLLFHALASFGISYQRYQGVNRNIRRVLGRK